MATRFSPMRPSTRAFLKEAREIPDYSWFDRLHGYIYMRWPYFYIGVATGRHAFARRFRPLVRWLGRRIEGGEKGSGTADDGRDASSEVQAGAASAGIEVITWADTYHGKAVPLDEARKLVRVDREIRVDDLEQVIPYKKARAIILKNPDHIVVLDCPCRTTRKDPCLPLDVCLIVGEPFASFVREHHPARSRWITAEQAVRILEEEDARGHVHHAFFKDAMLGRFYAICNCCACCCGAMKAHRHGSPMLASSGFVTEVDLDVCEACAACVDFCQFDALAIAEDRLVVERERCMGCGVCIGKCSNGALTMQRDASRGEPLEICTLMEQSLPIQS